MLLRTPEISETIRSYFRVAHRVLDVAMPKPCLQRSRIVACVRQCVTAGMSQHAWPARPSARSGYGTSWEP
jgi:hypothetical protein